MPYLCTCLMCVPYMCATHTYREARQYMPYVCALHVCHTHIQGGKAARQRGAHTRLGLAAHVRGRFALYVCLVCVPCMCALYALYVCPVCVPYMCALYVCQAWHSQHMSEIDLPYMCLLCVCLCVYVRALHVCQEWGTQHTSEVFLSCMFALYVCLICVSYGTRSTCPR